MQFKVPQFIEREARIIGPLTFRQFLFLGVGGVVVFILYSSMAQANLFIFIFLTLIITVASLSLAFMKVEGHPLPVIFLGFTSFVSNPRIYLWQRKTFVPQIQQKEARKEKGPVDDLEEIKIFRQSRLNELSNDIEIKK
jgi:hypothetical protein